MVSLKPGIEFAIFDWMKSKILNALTSTTGYRTR